MRSKSVTCDISGKKNLKASVTVKMHKGDVKGEDAEPVMSRLDLSPPSATKLLTELLKKFTPEEQKTVFDKLKGTQ